MIVSDHESSVTCATCGEAAVQRQVQVVHPPASSTVVYQTHAGSLHDDEHHEVLQRIERFHEQVHALETELNALPQEAKQLSAGRVLRFDVGGVKPSACEHRTLIVVSAEIQAYHQRVDFDLPPRPLDGEFAENLLTEIREAIKPVLTQLKARYERGDF